MSTTVTADFFVPVGSEKRVLAPALPVSDYTDDLDANFVRAYRGIVPIEAGRGLYRDIATAAEETAAARADPTVATEAVSSIPADANFAVANSASMQTDVLLAREFVASNTFHLPPPGGWIVAQRSENTAPAESLLRALADAVVTREGAARLFLDPVVPTEQNSAAAVLLKTDAALPVEILGFSRGDAPVSGESRGTYVVGVTLTLSDGRVITFPASEMSRS